MNKEPSYVVTYIKAVLRVTLVVLKYIQFKYINFINTKMYIPVEFIEHRLIRFFVQYSIM